MRDESRRRLLLFLALALTVAPGAYCKWMGPGVYYKAFDGSGDGVISRVEWDDYYRKYGGCCYKDFSKGDCDDNGLFTWSEYYDLRFSGKACSR